MVRSVEVGSVSLPAGKNGVLAELILARSKASSRIAAIDAASHHLFVAKVRLAASHRTYVRRSCHSRTPFRREGFPRENPYTIRREYLFVRRAYFGDAAYLWAVV